MKYLHLGFFVLACFATTGFSMPQLPGLPGVPGVPGLPDVGEALPDICLNLIDCKPGNVVIAPPFTTLLPLLVLKIQLCVPNDFDEPLKLVLLKITPDGFTVLKVLALDIVKIEAGFVWAKLPEGLLLQPDQVVGFLLNGANCHIPFLPFNTTLPGLDLTLLEVSLFNTDPANLNPGLVVNVLNGLVKLNVNYPPGTFQLCIGNLPLLNLILPNLPIPAGLSCLDLKDILSAVPGAPGLPGLK